MAVLVLTAGYVGYKLKRKVACIHCHLNCLQRKPECDMACDETFRYMADRPRRAVVANWSFAELGCSVHSCIQMPCTNQNATKFNLLTNQRELPRAGFYHLCQLRPVLRSLTHEPAKTLVQAFISSNLDYCNSLLYGVSNSLILKKFSPSSMPLLGFSLEPDDTNISRQFCANCIGFLSRDVSTSN